MNRATERAAAAAKLRPLSAVSVDGNWMVVADFEAAMAAVGAAGAASANGYSASAGPSTASLAGSAGVLPHQQQHHALTEMPSFSLVIIEKDMATFVAEVTHDMLRGYIDVFRSSNTQGTDSAASQTQTQTQGPVFMTTAATTSSAAAAARRGGGRSIREYLELTQRVFAERRFTYKPEGSRVSEYVSLTIKGERDMTQRMISVELTWTATPEGVKYGYCLGQLNLKAAEPANALLHSHVSLFRVINQMSTIQSELDQRTLELRESEAHRRAAQNELMLFAQASRERDDATWLKTRELLNAKKRKLKKLQAQIDALSLNDPKAAAAASAAASSGITAGVVPVRASTAKPIIAEAATAVANKPNLLPVQAAPRVSYAIDLLRDPVAPALSGMPAAKSKKRKHGSRGVMVVSESSDEDEETKTSRPGSAGLPAGTLVTMLGPQRPPARPAAPRSQTPSQSQPNSQTPIMHLSQLRSVDGPGGVSGSDTE
ncbi:hypothetical protein H9P43_004572 [Blastocladiella emersonii ATCC 22665]|nr:hypothetical protein H9P43_004572 [Blastocladiella emersonii ATCC 22665]